MATAARVPASSPHLVPPPPLEIHLQHQVMLAKRLEALDSGLAASVSYDVANRVFLATGGTKAFEGLLCTRCYAFRSDGGPWGGAGCTRCGSIPRRRSKRRRAQAGNPKDGRVVVAAASALTAPPSELASDSGAAAPQSLFAVLSGAPASVNTLPVQHEAVRVLGSDPDTNLPQPHSLPGGDTADASLTMPQPVATTITPSEAQGTQPPPVDLSDLLLSKSERKRKRLQQEQALPSPPPPSAAPAVASPLLAMLAASGLASVGGQGSVPTQTRTPVAQPAAAPSSSGRPWGGGGWPKASPGAATAKPASAGPKAAAGGSNAGPARFSFGGSRR